MSMDLTMYTRDRPILDERQNHVVHREAGDVFTWEEERWLYGGLPITIRAYRFDRENGDHDPLVAHFESDGDAPPEWAHELRWELHCGGGRPDDNFFDWFEDVCAASHGVIDNVYSGGLDRPDPIDIADRALDLIRAARPSWCDTDDRMSDLPLVDEAGNQRAPAGHEYGGYLADLDIVLSWEAAQYICLVTRNHARFLVMPEDNHEIVGGDEDGPCTAAIVARTRHPDPTIDRLMRDDPSVLRDYLLERGGPVDPLLHALAGADLPIVDRLPDSAALRDELVEFWERVIAADPYLGRYSLTELGVARPRYSAAERHQELEDVPE